MHSSCRPLRKTERGGGWTLLEVMVAMAVLMLILATVGQVIDSIGAAWRSGATDPFAPAQTAFEAISSDLARATLAPYEDYADTSGAFRTGASFVPDHLARRSDLAFVCGPASGTGGLMAASGRTTASSAVFFAAPDGLSAASANAGLGQLLNARGYFVEFGDQDSPAFLSLLSHQYRWRLKQTSQASEGLQVYVTGTSAAWIQGLTSPQAATSVLAENVVALVILPERKADDSGTALAPALAYDSRDTSNAVTLHQLPPRVRVVLVAIDVASAARLAALNGSAAPQLLPSGAFQQASALDGDVANLDAVLTERTIRHRIFQREIQMLSSMWSNASLP